MSEFLSPAETNDYFDAITLAQEANKEFDMRANRARSMAEVIERGSNVEFHHLAIMEQSDERFKKLEFAAKVLMPPRLVFESTAQDDYEPPTEAVRQEPPSAVSENISTELPESFASHDVWESMTVEQRTKATQLRSAIANSRLKEYGVTEDTLRVVMTQEKGKDKFTLVHTGFGVDLGDHDILFDEKRSYNDTMSSANNNLFNIEVNGMVYDTRTGMTDAVYRAIAKEALDRDVFLSDSIKLSRDTIYAFTATMLTGEPLTSKDRLRVQWFTEGKVRSIDHRKDFTMWYLRVCPAVAIK